jgi:hypothetical protein
MIRLHNNGLIDYDSILDILKEDSIDKVFSLIREAMLLTMLDDPQDDWHIDWWNEYQSEPDCESHPMYTKIMICINYKNYVDEHYCNSYHIQTGFSKLKSIVRDEKLNEILNEILKNN